MNIMNRLTWKSMAKNRTRTIVTAVGIALAAALFCAVITLGTSILHYLIELQIFRGGDYHVSSSMVPTEEASAVRENEQVFYTAEAQILGVFDPLNMSLGNFGGIVKACTPEYMETIPTGLQVKSGRLPEQPGEIVLGEHLVEALEQAGSPVQLGQELRLEVIPSIYIGGETYTNRDFYTDKDNNGLPELRNFELTGTLVGITTHKDEKTDIPGESTWSYVHILVDPSLPVPLYHNFYLRAADIRQAEALAEAVGGELNYDLLQYYGISQNGTVTYVLLGLAALVMGITCLCAVSLISNSFAISTAQRTRELGILASIGATRKQLRQSIRFEAVALCLLSIPVGLLLGLGTAGLAVHFLGDGVVMLFAAESTGRRLGLLVTPLGLLLSAAVAVATVFLSAWLPSRRTVRISPIEAIRQHRDYKTPKRLPRISRYGMKKPKLSALMARKYYRTSRGTYLPTILSLSISVALLLSATAAVSGIQTYADAIDNTENCHFHVEIYDADPQLLAKLQNHFATEKSVVYRVQTLKPTIGDEDISDERINAFRGTPYGGEIWELFETRWRKTVTTRVYYLEDSAFDSYMVGLGVDPSGYHSVYLPRGAVFLQKHSFGKSGDTLPDENGNQPEDGYYVDEFPLLADSVKEVFMVAQEPELEHYMQQQMGDMKCDGFSTLASGYEYLEYNRLIWWAKFHPTKQGVVEETGEVYKVLIEPGTIFRFLVKTEKDDDGQTVSRFYPYDLETDTAEETYVAELPCTAYDMRIGQTLTEIPYGLLTTVRNVALLSMLRPLSTLPQDAEATLHISLDTNNYPVTQLLLENLAIEGKIAYSNFVEEEYLARQVRDLVDAFCYTFVALMTVIATGNVFNTMSTNILLRRRDFGMLRSVGMSRRSIWAMVAAESLHCGLRALLLGVPIGLSVGYWVTTIIQKTVKDHVYSFPWMTLLIAVGSVLLVVLLSMLYALSCIRKDNSIDAIRMENT